MQIRFYNSLTHEHEVFEPAEPPEVSMYSCGLTVYDYAHIGNFRTFLFYDLLRRFLEFAGYEVRQVMNITDVGHMTEDELADGAGEDKMLVGARRLREAKKQGKADVENPDDPYQVADYFIKAFLEDAKLLGLKVADEYPQQMPRATNHIDQMQAMIQQLIERGHAYITEDGVVYYDIQSFPAYGRLSGNDLSRLRSGAGERVLEVNQALKRHPGDFFLWKPDRDHAMRWPSPWGEGYPGWHIECSAMATTVLGRQVIDIHTGGEDNIFPHHECEIAQTCGATGEDYFARFWMHSRHLLVDAQKMAKRSGTIYTIRDVVSGKITGRPVDPAVLRFELIRGHYRSNLNFRKEGLVESAKAVGRLRDMASILRDGGATGQDGVDMSHPLVAKFAAALANDLNISGALAALFEWIGGEHQDPEQSLAALYKIDSVLGLDLAGASRSDHDDDAAQRCQQIDQARHDKDYATADQIRAQLIEAGYDVQTTKAGTVAKKRLA